MSLDQLVARLEVATSKLEALATGGSAPASGASSGGGDSGSAMLDDYDELIINSALKKFSDLSNSIGGEVKEQADLVVQAFKAQREFLSVVSQSKDPKDQNVLQDLLKPTSEPLGATQAFKDTHRTKKEIFNHLSALAEGIPALGWVMITPKPAPYIAQMKESAEFYTNRVVKEYKDKDETHKSWARAFPALLAELQSFVKKHHTTGLVWNPKGGDAKSAAPASAPAAGGAPPPPGPPPPPMTEEEIARASKPAESSSGSPSSLFASINAAGDDITKGLKKVDKSQMTHKNPALRAGGTVPDKEKKAPAAAKKTAVDDNKPPKLELEGGKKWSVEYQKGNKNIIIDQTEIKQTVYVYKCNDSTIQIKGKINQITLDACTKTAVVVDDIVSAVDIINSKRCQIQITGSAPTLSIEKTDGVQLYLSKDALGIEIITFKSSEMNVIMPGETEDSDMIEAPIPEQFKTVIENKKLKTNLVEHNG